MKKKTIEEINRKISEGTAVVLTAEEVSLLGKTKSPEEIFNRVDVVTTATFGPMCSSGVFINFGHSSPAIRMEEITLNDVPVYAGIAAVDAYIGATSESVFNKKYGGGHIIEELIAGKEIRLKARGKGTDCYPKREIETSITKDSVNEIIMFNPRNAYQNYPVATNASDKTKYTYMGTLLPGCANANYSTSGELSPLLNDPKLRSIGIGTRIFLGGAQGYVAWNGTQFNTSKPRNEFDIPLSNAATLAVTGNAKEMSAEYIKAAYYEKYGVSLFVGIGIPIPVLDVDMAKAVSIRNEQIETTIYDYGDPAHPALGTTNYAELQKGEISLNGLKVKTAPLSSLKKAREIAGKLKKQILDKEFYLTEPVNIFPENTSLNSLKQLI
ncbi:MAG: homocysteine biosynthesis protein [Bacteroidales bacterium]|nr:homocysteine biosynthesis protein [Bacteroidales bacterium]